MTDFTEAELRSRIDRRLGPIGGEVASHEARIAELESKLANILLPAEVAGYLGEVELGTMRNVATRAVAATTQLENTQAAMLGLVANFNIAIEELRATVSGTIATLSGEDIELQERLALVEERINEVALLTTQMGSTVTATVDSMDDIGDVELSSLGQGQVLKWNGAAWVNTADDAGTTIDELGDIGDVVVTTPADNSLLAWDTTSSKWIDQSLSEVGASAVGHSHILDELTDVTISGPTSGEVLKYDGSAWTNQADASGTTIDSLADITDVVVTSNTDGELLVWDTSTSKWINQTLDEAGISASGHTHSDKLDASAYTATDVLSKIITVDGTGSLLDADLLDGQHAAAFAASAHSHTLDNLSDVSTTGQIAGSLLTSDGANWTPTTGITIGTGEYPLVLPILSTTPSGLVEGAVWILLDGSTYKLQLYTGSEVKSLSFA